MPSRSYYNVADFDHIEALLLDLHGESFRDSWSAQEIVSVCPLVNEESLAAAIGVDLEILKKISRKIHKHYREFQIVQKNKKIRNISAPRTYLKVIQWWILDNILSKFCFPDCVHGFVPGKSAATNATFHFGAQHIVNIDIKDFFPSINSDKVETVFIGLGYEKSLSKLLTKFCTLRGSLPQGAPTSPSLANLVSAEMDNDFQRLADSLNCQYTRYADDITFSSKFYIDIDILTYSKEILAKYGFSANESKTKLVGQGGRLEVTGFVINKKVQMRRQWRKRVRAIFHQASIAPNEFSDRKRELSGYISMLSSFSENSKTLQSYKVILNSVP